MNIRRSSWHFRLYARYARFFEFKPEPTNLCRYFWTITLLTVGLMLFGPPLAVLVGIVFFGVVWPICTYRDSNFRRRRKARLLEAGKARKAREPGVITTYLRARKAKVCPLITVIDEERA